MGSERVYLWRWLIDFKWNHSVDLFNSNRNIKEYHTVYLLLNHYRALGVFYEDEMVKSLKELIKKSDTFSNPYFIRYLAYSMLGKMNFEKGLFRVALTHFKEALKNFESLKVIDQEEKARLYAWIGLSSFKLGLYKDAEKYFSEAIHILENLNVRKPVIGELHVLLADAFYFTNPNEAIQEAELAHEILKGFHSPFFVVNAVKLAAGLIARNYEDEGYSVLYEATEKFPEVAKLLNIGFIKTLKVVEENAKKILFYKEPKTLSSLKEMFYGLEGLKGFFYMFRKIVKPDLEPSRLVTFNSKIISSLNKPDKAEEIIQLKNNFIKKTENMGMQTIGDYPIYKTQEKIDHLVKMFGEVGVLSFYKGINPNEYRVNFYWKNNAYESFISKIVSIDDYIVETTSMDAESASEVISRYLPDDILNKIQNMSEGGLVIISPVAKLYSVPWDLIPTNNAEKPYLGLKNVITIVPNLHELRFWEKEAKPYNRKLYYGQFEKLPRGITKEIVSHIKDLGYWKHKNFGKELANNLVTSVELLLYIGDIIESVDGDLFIKLGNNYFSVLDIEKIKIRGLLAILGTPAGSETIIDEFGAHNFMISFLLAGFKSVIACLSPPRNIERLKNFIYLFLKDDGYYIYEKIRNTKLKMYRENSSWWIYQLYGDPLVVV